MPPDRTRCGRDSVMATIIVADDSVDIEANTPQAVYSAAPVRSWSNIQKVGNTRTARNSQGMIMIGLRPNRSDSQPPSESQNTPLSPITAVAPNAMFAG